jgi:hypothetical protein
LYKIASKTVWKPNEGYTKSEPNRLLNSFVARYQTKEIQIIQYDFTFVARYQTKEKRISSDKGCG